MKKIYSILLIMLVATISFGKQRPFERHKKHSAELNKIIHAQTSKQPFSLLSLVNVPTITKYSSWDEFNNIWVGNGAQKLIINNNQLTTTYYLGYNLIDTISRTIYTYDNQGRYIAALSENKDNSTNTYFAFSRTSITYSTNGLVQIAVIENYDTALNTWVNNAKILYEKDDRGAELKIIYYYFNNNNWEVSFGYSKKISYLNSNSLKTIEVIDSSYDFNTKSMKAAYKFTQSYDVNERAVDLKFYEPDFITGNLTLITQDSIYYDANGLPNLLVEKEVDANGNASNLLRYKDVTWVDYNPNLNIFENNPTGYIVDYNISGTWLLAGRLTTSFPDNYGSIIQTEEAYEAGNFVPNNKSTVLYNSFFDIIEEKEETFNSMNNSWVVDYGNKYLISYDSNNNQSEHITQNYNNNVNQFVNNTRNEYSDYVLVNTYVSNKIKNKLVVYPNPVNTNNLTIKYNKDTDVEANVSIYDLNAKLIKKETLLLINSVGFIKIDDLEKGIYLIQLETKDNSSFTKFIKE